MALRTTIFAQHLCSYFSYLYLDATFFSITELMGPTLSLSLTYITRDLLRCLEPLCYWKLRPMLLEVEVRPESRQ